MLSGYFDETGHSQDQKQRFNGMAGVLAPADHWEAFEEKWKRTLDEFKIPFFHMKDFSHSKGHYNGWPKAKQEKLYGKLLGHMTSAYLLPVGVSIPMTAFRSFSQEKQKLFTDPYYLGFLTVITLTTVFMNNSGMAKEEKAALVFSEQMEFKNRALRLFDEIMETKYDTVQMHNSARTLKARVLSPVFREMREFAAVQAADIVAYEIYKEHERRLGLRKDPKPRHGYRKLIEMSNKLDYKEPFCKFHTQADIADFIEAMELEQRRKAYWEKRRAKA